MEQVIQRVIEALQDQGVKVISASDAGTSAPVLAVPEGIVVHTLEHLQAAPAHTDGITVLHRYDDFVTYVNDFKQDGARIFVEPKLEFSNGGTLATAILDFPRPGNPAWSSHKAQLVVSPSLEYRLLCKVVDAGLTDQPKFALALKELARFNTSLSSADLLEIVQTLTLQSKGDFASIEDNFTGSARFSYDVKVSASSEATKRLNIEVPTHIGFHMPVLLGGDAVDMVAEFMYRVPPSKDEKVKMGLGLPDRAFVERAVLEATADKLAAATGLTVAVGGTTVPKSQGNRI